MATWKRLKRVTEKGDEIDVNMDTVAHMQRYVDHTLIQFAGGQSVTVRETPDDIHLTSPRELPQAKPEALARTGN